MAFATVSEARGLKGGLLVLFVLLATSGAFAQAEGAPGPDVQADVPPPSEGPPAVPLPPPEAPEAIPPDHPTPPREEERVDPRTEEAIQRFRQGLTLARAGNCAGAIAELQASLDIVERPNTLFNIARCQEELFRYDLAVAAYERYLEVAPADAPDQDSVRATMRQLRNLLGTIVVRSNVPAAVWIGDRQVGEAPGEVLVPGGRHAVELRADGYLPSRREVEVPSRARVELEVELETADVTINNQNITNVEQTNVTEQGGAPPAVFYTGLALTGVSLATAIGFSARVLGLRSDGDEIAPTDFAGRTAQNDRIADKARIADVFWGVTAGLAVTTVVLAFVTDWDGDPETREGFRVSPAAGEGQAGLVVSGSF